jgi:hypothetical protein
MRYYNNRNWYVEGGMANFAAVACFTIFVNTFVNGLVDVDRLAPLIFGVIGADIYFGCCSKQKQAGQSFKNDYLDNARASPYDIICGYTDNVSAVIACCALSVFLPMLVPLCLGSIILRYYFDRFMIANYWSEPEFKLDGGGRKTVKMTKN